MNRILRRTILKSLSEQDRDDGLLSGHELLVWAPKNLVVNLAELTATCRVLEQRQRIQMHDLHGVRDVFIADLTPAGRRAYRELQCEDSLALDILWTLHEIRSGHLKLYWGATGGALVDDVVATLAQLLQVRDEATIRGALSGLHARELVYLVRGRDGQCVKLSINDRGSRNLKTRLANL